MSVFEIVFLSLVVVLFSGFSVLVVFMAWWCRDKAPAARSQAVAEVEAQPELARAA